MSEHKLTLNDQITPGLKSMGSAASAAAKRLDDLNKSAEDTAQKLERIKKAEYLSALNKYPAELKKITKNMTPDLFKGMAVGAGIGFITRGTPGAFTGAWQGGLGSYLLSGIDTIPKIDKSVNKVETAKEAYEKSKTPVTKASEAGYYEWEERYRKFYEQQQNGSRDFFLQGDLEGSRKQMEKILTTFNVTRTDMVGHRWEGKTIYDDPRQILASPQEQPSAYQFLQQEREAYGTPMAYRFLERERLGFNNSSSIFDPSSDPSGLQGLNEQFELLRDTSQDTLSFMQTGFTDVSARGVQPLSSRIDHTSDLLSNVLTDSAESSFTGMASGLMGVNTNFGLVQASSMGAFQQIDQGLSNNTDAMQLLLNQGIEPAALGFGTLLPEQLGLFQDAHATTFTTAGDPARPY